MVNSKKIFTSLLVCSLLLAITPVCFAYPTCPQLDGGGMSIIEYEYEWYDYREVYHPDTGEWWMIHYGYETKYMVCDVNRNHREIIYKDKPITRSEFIGY